MAVPLTVPSTAPLTDPLTVLTAPFTVSVTLAGRLLAIVDIVVRCGVEQCGAVSCSEVQSCSE